MLFVELKTCEQQRILALHQQSPQVLRHLEL
jgi:hypothetical protein